MQTTIFFMALAAIALYFYWQHQTRIYQHKQLIRWYNTRTRPIIVWSSSPQDDTVEERAEHHRQMLSEAGNKWNVIVHAFPYSDVQFGSSKYEDFYLEYPQRLGEFAAKVARENAVHLKSIDAKAYSEFVLNQQQPYIQQ